MELLRTENISIEFFLVGGVQQVSLDHFIVYQWNICFPIKYFDIFIDF